jgi:hypothetical protein
MSLTPSQMQTRSNEVVLRHFVLDMSHEKVASELDLTPEQAAHLAHQGLRWIKEQVFNRTPLS